jgi:LysM repeat protein
MIGREMAGRSPARFLAPLALVTFAVALLWVVRASTVDEDRSATGGENRTAAGQSRAGDGGGGTTTRKRTRRVRKTYVVKPGDTASSIAERYDVPLSQIEDLNPELDPQALAPGTRIRLRR